MSACNTPSIGPCPQPGADRAGRPAAPAPAKRPPREFTHAQLRRIYAGTLWPARGVTFEQALANRCLRATLKLGVALEQHLQRQGQRAGDVQLLHKRATARRPERTPA